MLLTNITNCPYNNSMLWPRERHISKFYGPLEKNLVYAWFLPTENIGVDTYMMCSTDLGIVIYNMIHSCLPIKIVEKHCFEPKSTMFW